MSRKTGIIFSLAALVIVAGGIIAFLATRSEGPPLKGWMQAFQPVTGQPTGSAGAFFDKDGIPITLRAFRGKLVLLNVWATWCGPCIREMPSFIRLQEKMRGEDVVIVALSQDRGGWKVIEPFIKKHGFEKLTVYHDQLKFSFGPLKIRGLPTTILFDRDGKELGRLPAAAEWDAQEAVDLLRYYLKS